MIYGKNEFFKVKSKQYQDFYNFSFKLNNFINQTAAHASCSNYDHENDIDMLSISANEIEN